MEKSIIIVCLFFLFSMILVVCSWLSTNKKISIYKNEINFLKSEIMNAEIQNHRKEIAYEDMEIERANFKGYINKFIQEASQSKIKLTEISNLLNKIKIEKNTGIDSINTFVKATEDGMMVTEELYKAIDLAYNKNPEFEKLNIHIDNLKKMSNDVAINAAIESTKMKQNGISSDGLIAVSDTSRKLYENYNMLLKDIENLKRDFTLKVDGTDKIKHVCKVQEDTAKAAEYQFDKVYEILEELLKGLDEIIDKVYKFTDFKYKKM